MTYKDDCQIATMCAYKKNVDLVIAGKSIVSEGDSSTFWKWVKLDAKSLLKTSAEIMNELRVEREGK